MKRMVSFWTVPIRAEPLALFRILLAGVMLVSILTSLLWDLRTYLGPDGLCPGKHLTPWLAQTHRICLLADPATLPLLGSLIPRSWAQTWVMWLDQAALEEFLFAGWLLSLLFVGLGLYTRPAVFLAWLLTLSFHHRLPWLLNGGDDLGRAGLFYLLFADSGAVWSLDSLRRPRVAPGFIPAWPVRLMQVQLVCVYFFAGLSKLHGDWLTGEAVWWVLHDFSLTRWPYAWSPVPLGVCRFLSWGIVLFELFFAVAMIFRRLRAFWLLLGLVFHLALMLILEIGFFSPTILCWYALFLRGERLGPRTGAVG